MYVGSCIQTEADIETLANVAVSSTKLVNSIVFDSKISLFYFFSFYVGL